MNSKIATLLVTFILSTSVLLAQEKTKKQIKEEERLELQAQVEALIESKTFVFSASTATAQGFRPVGISPIDNYVIFTPDSVESKLPFYGKSYGNMGFGDDIGLKFRGKPENFTITKKKKNIRVDTIVKDDLNAYRLVMTIGYNGRTSLSISSNSRSPVTFSGAIWSGLEEEENLQPEN